MSDDGLAGVGKYPITLDMMIIPIPALRGIRVVFVIAGRGYFLSVVWWTREFAGTRSVFPATILLSYAHSSNWREWLYRAVRREGANAARTRPGGVSPRHDGCARRRGGDSRQSQTTQWLRSGPEAFCSGCVDRPCHQFWCADRRADEHLSWRDQAGGHAQQHRRVPCGGHFARHRKWTAAGSAPYGTVGATTLFASLPARELAAHAQDLSLGDRRL